MPESRRLGDAGEAALWGALWGSWGPGHPLKGARWTQWGVLCPLRGGCRGVNVLCPGKVKSAPVKNGGEGMERRGAGEEKEGKEQKRGDEGGWQERVRDRETEERAGRGAREWAEENGRRGGQAGGGGGSSATPGDHKADASARSCRRPRGGGRAAGSSGQHPSPSPSSSPPYWPLSCVTRARVTSGEINYKKKKRAKYKETNKNRKKHSGGAGGAPGELPASRTASPRSPPRPPVCLSVRAFCFLSHAGMGEGRSAARRQVERVSWCGRAARPLALPLSCLFWLLFFFF